MRDEYNLFRDWSASFRNQPEPVNNTIRKYLQWPKSIMDIESQLKSVHNITGKHFRGPTQINDFVSRWKSAHNSTSEYFFKNFNPYRIWISNETSLQHYPKMFSRT